MEIYIAALTVGVLIYFLVRLLIPVTEKEMVKGRIFKYFSVNTLDDVAEQVMRERHNSSRRSNELNKRLISKDFEEYVSSSGVKLTPSEFFYAWVGVTLIPATLFALVGLNIVTVFAAGVIGLIAPPFFLVRAKKKRQELFTAQLGEALVIMGNAIKGGFSFTQAMESVASEMQEPIAPEFRKSIREMQYGITQEEALREMADRIKNEDLDLLVSAVLTSAQVGGNLSDILDAISSTIKDRIRIKQEVRVLTSTGRMSAVIIALLPIILIFLLMLINPEYLGLFFETNVGKIMLMVSVVLEITGFLVIRKISDIQY